MMESIVSLSALMALAILSSSLGQSQSFEVASVRQNKNLISSGNIAFPPGGERFAATNVPLGALIQMAYNVTNPQCSCQNPALPVLSERFDIQAEADHPMNASEMLRLIRNLLADRFRVEVRRETKPLDAYAMVVDKARPKLVRSSAQHINDFAPLNPYHARGVEGHGPYSLDVVIADATMPDFAGRLSSLTILEGHVVVDKTGLDGHYDIELKLSGVSPTEQLSANDAPSIFTALREQLGLRLELHKMPIEVVTVINAERPTEN
jgi:uncharacterized protein (TIGR03435 family)